jgi:hypothetical protein
MGSPDKTKSFATGHITTVLIGSVQGKIILAHHFY